MERTICLSSVRTRMPLLEIPLTMTLSSISARLVRARLISNDRY